MRFGICIPNFGPFADVETLSREIREVEALGFDSAWFSDHMVAPEDQLAQLPPDWFDTLASVIHGLAITDRLIFGTDVLVTGYRNPIVLAKLVATAARLSSDRFVLGLGTGWVKKEFEAFGIPFAERGAVTDEYLTVIRMLLTSQGAVEFDGRYAQFSDIHFGPRPSRPVPILIGGNVRRAVTRAALHGDGWQPLFPEFDDYAATRRFILDRREADGLTDPFLFSYSAPVCRILSGDPAAPTVGSDNGDFECAPGIPVTTSGRRRFFGTAEQVAEDFADLAEAGVEQVVVRFCLPGDEGWGIEQELDQLRLLASALPDLRSAPAGTDL